MLRILCVLGIVIVPCAALIFSTMPDQDFTLTFSTDIDHIIFLKLEYLRYLASMTLYNTNSRPYGRIDLLDAFQLFRQAGNISGDFSDFIYSLSDGATSQDILSVYRDSGCFDKYTHPLAKNKAIDIDEDLIFLAINTSFVIRHYMEGKPRLTEKELLETVLYRSKRDIEYCFFGDKMSLIENAVFPLAASYENKEVVKKYYIGVVLNDEMSRHDAFYLSAFAAMRSGVYFKDLNENPYNGGFVLITSIPLPYRGE
jgi:hypothetical protein